MSDQKTDEELLALDLETSVHELEAWADHYAPLRDKGFDVAVSRVWNVAHTLRTLAKDNNGTE